MSRTNHEQAVLDEELIAAARGHDARRLQELLAAGANVEVADYHGLGPLHTAAAIDALAAVEALIAAGAHVEAGDINGRRPLHVAGANDALAATKSLIAAGADVDAPDSTGRRPLHVAARNDASAAMKTLIAAGADVQGIDFNGRSPLHVAAANGATAAAKALIEAGAGVNAADSWMCVPLHAAVRNSHTRMARVLLEAGADPMWRNHRGMSPLNLARVSRSCDIVGILEAEVARRAAPHQLPSGSEKHGESSASGEIPSHEPITVLQSSTVGQTSTVASPGDGPSRKHSQVQCTELSRKTVHASLQQSQIAARQEDFMSHDSDSSWTSEEATEKTRAVQNLKEGDVFAKNYCLEAKVIFGKPLVRLAKELLTNGGVVLKFYDKPELYTKALSFFKRLNKSDYICKPIERIAAHQGFPDCLAFEKGIHTLDEWLRIPNIRLSSKKEALELVAAALYDLHRRGVVHCDVKPANLAFFPAEHKWKLLDIDSALEIGVAGDIMTTISYASPEVLMAVEKGRTNLALQSSTDMWAYGIIAFEVFTGKRFYEHEPTLESVLQFLTSEKLKLRLDSVEDKKERHYVKKFLKLNPSDRRSAQNACTSSIFRSGTVTVSGVLVSRHVEDFV